ncbi:hypothetical protein GCM10010483_39810 [Actinokineospora diospyrosa]
MAPLDPSVQGLGRWAGADLTEVGQTPATPRCPGAGWWGGADLAGLEWRRWVLVSGGQSDGGGPDRGWAGYRGFRMSRGWVGRPRPDLAKGGGGTSSFRVPNGWWVE